MNRKMIKARWKQYRGKAKIWRARLRGDQLGRMSGMFDVLVGGAQERITTTRAKSAREVKRRVARFQSRMPRHRQGSK